MDLKDPRAFRLRCREGRFKGNTAAVCPGKLQANVVILDKEWAYDFLVFCQRNPKPCPIVEITDPGCFEVARMAPGSDIRKDVPQYRVFEHGILTDEPTDVTDLWHDDSVAFLLGCSFTFDDALSTAGIKPRHIEMGVNVPMFKTAIRADPSNRLHGNYVVSMRPMLPHQIVAATSITSRYPFAHGRRSIGDWYC
mmetsp:Transcript_14492/g.36922  ORF Transcript_14492/g.36922 Transcript_14492/m.36922 type:complete len:195 (+) Transcript_14492:269-853(+)